MEYALQKKDKASLTSPQYNAMFYTIIFSLLYFICTLFQHNELNLGGHKNFTSG